MRHETLSEDPLVGEQFRVVISDLPRLYVMVIVGVAFIALLVHPYVSPALLWAWAAVLIVVAVVRGLHWWNIPRSAKRYSLMEMRAKLKEVDRIGTALLCVFGSVAYLVMQAPDALLRTTTMLAVWAAIVGTAFCLSVLPQTARRMMFFSSACLSVVLLWMGGRTLYMVTPLFVAISYALVIQLQRNFETFKASVDANAALEALRRDALSLAKTDALTGLPNRRGFEERLAGLIASAQPFTLALIDLDGFKPVNDVFGHGAGDRVLKAAATQLRALDSRVFVSRFGGDEFVLLIEDPASSAAIAAEAVDALSSPYDIDSLPIRIGASCGLAYWRKEGDEEGLIGRADSALYQAKARPGRGAASDDRKYAVVECAA